MTVPSSHRIAVIGAGYVGLATAACLASLGHDVQCSDKDHGRVELLNSGGMPIFEDGLEELVKAGISSGRLAFGIDNTWAVENAEFVFLCLPTPEDATGGTDMTYVEDAVIEISPYLKPGSVVVNKSTVPVGSSDEVERLLARDDVSVVSNPEFLREGSAINDFLHPDRIVIGAQDEESAIRVSAIFAALDGPVVFSDRATAETIKYASNAFLATKVSFVNSIAELCDAVGADVRKVCAGLGLDPRIGSAYLHPGPGWGGSCLPKDTAALVKIAEKAGFDFRLLKSVITANQDHYDMIAGKVARLAGGSLSGVRVALWGVTFKAQTDDLRRSPALEIANRLRDAGAVLTAYDPTLTRRLRDIKVEDDAYSACMGASVLLVATEWDEFRHLDFDKVGSVMVKRAIVDARNLLDPEIPRAAGFEYEGIGIP